MMEGYPRLVLVGKAQSLLMFPSDTAVGVMVLITVDQFQVAVA